MNGRKAKALRKRVYGKGGEKNEREYGMNVKVFKKKENEEEPRTSTSIVNRPGTLRAMYQALKRDLRRS